MNGLVIDPATKSIGWCWIKDGKIFKSGTIKVEGKIHIRLLKIYKKLKRLFEKIKFDYVITERMNRNTHYTVNFAIGVIFLAFAEMKCKYIVDSISPSAWKRFYGLTVRAKGVIIKNVFRKIFPKMKVKSDDEIEAILMANYLLNSKKII